MAMSENTDSEKALEHLHGLGDEHFCVRCCNVVKTKTVSGFSADPFGGNKQVTSPPVCALCGAGVVKYDAASMAKLLKHQMGLLEEGKRIEEMARRLRQELDQARATLREREAHIDEIEGRYWHPDTGRIINRSETAIAGAIGRVRTGWQGKVFELTDDGMREALEYIRLTAARPAYPDLRDQVERLRKENADLRDKLEKAGAVSPKTRSSRSIQF